MTRRCSPAAMMAAACAQACCASAMSWSMLSESQVKPAPSVPVDAQLAAHLLLAHLPVAALDELHDRHLPVAAERPQHHAERRRALALAVAGVDQHERRDGAHAARSRVVGGRLGEPIGGGVVVLVCVVLVCVVLVHVVLVHEGWEHRHGCATVAPSCRTNGGMHGVQRSPVRSRHCPATVVPGLSRVETSPVA